SIHQILLGEWSINPCYSESFEQSIDIFAQVEDYSVVGANAFEDPVAIEETLVINGYFRAALWLVFAVDVYYRPITRHKCPARTPTTRSNKTHTPNISGARQSPPTS